MAIRHIVAVFEADGLTPTEKLVLLKLADNANDDGLCWPSREHIVRHTGCSEATVKRTLRSLKRKGFIDVEPQIREGGLQGVNLYRLNLSPWGVTVSPQGGHSDPARGVTVSPGTVNNQTPRESHARGRARDARFEEFWNAYPKGRRRAKKRAREIWTRKRLDERADEIIDDVRKRAESDAQWVRGYVPMPTTYLNGDRWEDEFETVETDQDRKESTAAVWDEIVAVAGASRARRTEFMADADATIARAINAAGGLQQIGTMQPHQLREARSRFAESLQERSR
jgi:biotin operon repressor